MVKYSHEDSIYLGSLADDLDRISDEIRHLAWEVEGYGEVEPYHLEIEGLAIRIDKVSTLFKQRIKK